MALRRRVSRALALWLEPVHERRVAAVEVLARHAGVLAAADLGRFERYAVPVLADPEFFIRKAVGRVLREICGADPGWAAAWTGRHLPQMSGVTFREAVRRLPPSDADRLRSSRAALAYAGHH